MDLDLLVYKIMIGIIIVAILIKFTNWWNNRNE